MNQNIDVCSFFKPQLQKQIIKDEAKATEENKILSKNLIVLICKFIFFSSIYMIFKISAIITDISAGLKK